MLNPHGGGGGGDPGGGAPPPPNGYVSRAQTPSRTHPVTAGREEEKGRREGKTGREEEGGKKSREEK
jgi:hypothetical protein